MLEDFGSKNGTFRGENRVTAPVQLADGDVIRIGSLLVTFHERADDVDGHQCAAATACERREVHGHDVSRL